MKKRLKEMEEEVAFLQEIPAFQEMGFVQAVTCIIGANPHIHFNLGMELQHVSHEHSLILKEQVELIQHIGKELVVCYGCRKPVVGGRLASGYAAVYICTRADGCDFYLHKTCAELPDEIQHPLHDQHPLILHARLSSYGTNTTTCDICKRASKWFTYTCFSCDFDVCLTCKDRLIRHDGHKHELTLLPGEIQFLCNACGMKAEDMSYACHACAFWIHNTCAFSPTTVTPSFHPHPLFLKYSLPDMDRKRTPLCCLCNKRVLENSWVYYCDECRYFVHMECGTLSEEEYTSRYREEEIADIPNLKYFPVDNKESLLNLITDHIGKTNIINLGEEEGEKATTPDHLIYHESHREHALLLLEEFDQSFKNNDDAEILCDGCVKPVSTAHPFYGCIGCNFFLHKVCAELPPELPVGECPRHPEHSLSKHGVDNFFNCVECTTCSLSTNGFYFRCETCKITVDTGCAFLPTKIKHKSHEHPLVQQHASSKYYFPCKSCGWNIISPYMEFMCETCSSFRIHIECAQNPSEVRHRWDPHPISLKYPPFFCRGIIYCEICEEEVDPKLWLYYCDKCNQSFHTYCLNPPHNVKLGSTLLVVDIHPHILTFVQNKNIHLLSSCSLCYDHDVKLVLECAQCEFQLCLECVRQINM